MSSEDLFGLETKKANKDDDIKGLDDDLDEETEQRRKVLGFDEDEVDEKKTEKKDFHEAIRLADAFQGLVGKSLYSDCTFIVGKHAREIPAHRLILASASRVFNAMLYPSSDFPASPTEDAAALNQILVPDVEPEIFLSILRGIYTDKPEVTEETVGGVIKAARKYELEKILVACSLFLEEGVTKENALGLFNRSVELTGGPDLALQFIEKWADKIIQQPAFVSLKKERLLHLLQSDKLGIKEANLFKGVLRWAQAECKRQDLPNSPDNLKVVLDGVLELIRFPAMSMTDLATLVMPSGVLSPAQALEIYQYLGSRDPQTGKSAMTTKFQTKLRVGGFVFNFQFDANKKGTNCTVTQDGHLITGTAESYSCVLGNTPLSTETKSYWEIKVNSNSQDQGSWRIAIGIGTASLNLNSYISEGVHGWGYFNQGCRCHADGNGQLTYGGRYSTGAVVGVLFDPEKKSLSYYLNGKSLGVAWSDIPVSAQPLFPAVHVNAGVILQLMDVDAVQVPDVE